MRGGGSANSVPNDALVIFDCDGVLVDSEIIACEIEALFLSKAGYAITTEQLIEKFLGVEKSIIRETVERESGIQLPEDYPRLLHRKIMPVLEEKLQPAPGIKRTLDLIPNKCVASGGPMDKIEMSLRVTDLKNFFSEDALFSADMVSRPKPAPDLHLYVIQKMGYAPSRCIVVEDSAIGISAARYAGLTVFGYIGGQHACHSDYGGKLRKAGAHSLFNDMEDLPRLLSDYFD